MGEQGQPDVVLQVRLGYALGLEADVSLNYQDNVLTAVPGCAVCVKVTAPTATCSCKPVTANSMLDSS